MPSSRGEEVVDLDDLPTIKEFELFKEYFEANGYPAIICSPSELEFKNEGLSCNGTQIDIVYKRLLVNEYLPKPMDEIQLRLIKCFEIVFPSLSASEIPGCSQQTVA